MIINSESEYLIACGQLEELMDNSISENDTIISELAESIEAYEDANYPIDSPVDDVMEYPNE